MKRSVLFFVAFLLLGLIPYSLLADGEEYDYVDQLSDEDASEDKGTHGNFTDMKYGPDSNLDLLTEENTGNKPKPIYEIDLEVQWINANYSRDNEVLAIYVGSCDPEGLDVFVRSGSSWVLVIDNISPNSWNNVSVASYLDSSTFTIRFLGSNETDLDVNEDSWEIDCSLLHTYDDPLDPPDPPEDNPGNPGGGGKFGVYVFLLIFVAIIGYAVLGGKRG